MCRYATHGPYKEKYVCFHCRKAFKQTSHWELRYPMRKDDNGKRLVPCPECGRSMKNMGLDFKAPRQSDIRQWKKVELLFAYGYNYSSCGCNGPGPRPATLKEVPAFLEEEKRQKAEWERQREIAERASEREAKRRKRKLAVSTKRQATNTHS